MKNVLLALCLSGLSAALIACGEKTETNGSTAQENGSTAQENSSTDQEEVYDISDKSATQAYNTNQADRHLLKEFEKRYGIASRLGSGENQLTLILGALKSMSWSSASSHLQAAVSDMKSFKSGESPDSRNAKMDKFMNIFKKY